MDKEGTDFDENINCSSVSVYGIIRSWILQEPLDKPPEYFNGILIVKKIENVRMLDRYNHSKPSSGTLYVTATHLIFVGPDCKKETWILHNHIASVDKLPLTTSGSQLQIRCKDFLSVTFVIPKERDCHDVYITLSQLSKPVRMDDLYCFHYTSSTEDIPRSAGWNFFDLQSEFQRMRVPNDQWSLTLFNKSYEICDTYPRYLYVPSSATPQMIIGSSSFRSKGRLPVLTYLHKNKAAICRCSQPLSGFSARCLEDELMLNDILRTNPNASYMYVVDTRPRINAMANRATGKGYENELFYENIKFQFLGIENIHVMRSSLAKLVETCELKAPTMSQFLRGLESSGWLKHIQAVLETSVFIAQAVENGVSVVVHCSDGWDRTAQVCALAEVLLDPHYRTIHGFQALIEKDWLSFGHKFTERFGYLLSDPKEVSPVFTQFVDAVWQLSQLFPTVFQFNERFLLTIHDHAASCQYGTFVGNCEKDRVDLRLSERTFSLWGYIANHMGELVNPLYCPADNTGTLSPPTSPQHIRFWRGMYCRFEGGIHPRESLPDVLLSLCDHSSSLSDHVRLLQKRITSLKKLLGDNGNNTAEKTTPQIIQEPIDNNHVVEKDNKIDYVSQKETETVTEDTPSADKENMMIADKMAAMKVTTKGSEITAESLKVELDSVALDWKTLRNIVECSCSTPFDHFTRKYHCWRCGDIFCTRCIDKLTPLPGHVSRRPVPVCRQCYTILKTSACEDHSP